METRTATETDRELRRLRRISWLFLGAAVLFFPMIFNPVTFGFFDAASEAERLSHVEENLTALRVLFSGIGVAELALGVALWLWGGRSPITLRDGEGAWRGPLRWSVWSGA